MHVTLHTLLRCTVCGARVHSAGARASAHPARICNTGMPPVRCAALRCVAPSFAKQTRAHLQSRHAITPCNRTIRYEEAYRGLFLQASLKNCQKPVKHVNRSPMSVFVLRVNHPYLT